MGLAKCLFAKLLVILIVTFSASCGETRYYQAPDKPLPDPTTSTKPDDMFSNISVNGTGGYIQLVDGGLTITEGQLERYYKDNETGPSPGPIAWPRSIKVRPGTHVVTIVVVYQQVVLALDIKPGHNYEIYFAETTKEELNKKASEVADFEDVSVRVIDTLNDETVLFWQPGQDRPQPK